MTDERGLQPTEGEAKTTMYRPGPEGGLEAGDEIVTEGTHKLRDGSSVETVAPITATAPSGTSG